MIILGIFAVFSCKAQVISLDQVSQCESGNCPNYTSIKDTNNRLNKFTGIWKGNYTDGTSYEFKFTKEIDYAGYGGKHSDLIIGRIQVKKADGTIIKNNLNVSDSYAKIKGLEFDKSLTKYQLYYSGNAECNDKGYVYISFPDPNNLNQMRLVFIQDRDIVASCPSGYKTLMPDGKAIILTKH
ncbi:DUF6705 family protein [Chryseobacterium aurantiacum]|uniref:DUF6705 family protein n=1 Tax=Chryseobacterium aurantiacum TaxID=2116499 RepID=UPI000D13C267|nr:DUF6705 family protein [Chryseobacterium aurantiacum]